MNSSTPPSPGRAMENFYFESKASHEEAEAPRKPNVFDPGNLSELLNWNPLERCADFSVAQTGACSQLEPESEKEMLLWLAYRFVLTSFFAK
ncbi:hypothetical protein [Noviherbaspirillum soli]|uniref:hypothetical protein n=1 Tax=Noviherbaspirillum soli TaxID=1064518 RepID=UPI00188AB3BF|nr:hypothetical protein [Noviherbaspirillum soli]